MQGPMQLHGQEACMQQVCSCIKSAGLPKRSALSGAMRTKSRKASSFEYEAGAKRDGELPNEDIPFARN